VKTPAAMTPTQFADFVAKMRAQHEGVENAFKTLYLGDGADASVVGANMQQMDYAAVQGKGETRIANAAGVPPVLLSFSEGMQGSSLNAGNYQSAKRSFVDTTMRDLWLNWCGSLQALEALRPEPKLRLWYDARDIPFLHEDAKDIADIQATQSSTISSYVTAGFKPETAVSAVHENDITKLVHSGAYSVQLQPPGMQDADGDGTLDGDAKAEEDYQATLDAARSEVAEWEIERKGRHNVRNPEGSVGGGRFRKLSDTIVALLDDWKAGDRQGDPLANFETPQLKKAAEQLGIELPAGRQSKPGLKKLILEHQLGKKGDDKESEDKRFALTDGQHELLSKASKSESGVIDVDKSDPDVKALAEAGYIDLDPRSNRAEITGRGELKLNLPHKSTKAAPKVGDTREDRSLDGASDAELDALLNDSSDAELKSLAATRKIEGRDDATSRPALVDLIKKDVQAKREKPAAKKAPEDIDLTGAEMEEVHQLDLATTKRYEQNLANGDSHEVAIAKAKGQKKTPAKAAPRLSAADREKRSKAMVRDYESGMSISEVAEKHGVSTSAAHDSLTKAGTQLRPRGGTAKKAAPKAKPERPSTVAELEAELGEGLDPQDRRVLDTAIQSLNGGKTSRPAIAREIENDAKALRTRAAYILGVRGDEHGRMPGESAEVHAAGVAKARAEAAALRRRADKLSGIAEKVRAFRAAPAAAKSGPSSRPSTIAELESELATLSTPAQKRARLRKYGYTAEQIDDMVPLKPRAAKKATPAKAAKAAPSGGDDELDEFVTGDAAVSGKAGASGGRRSGSPAGASATGPAAHSAALPKSPLTAEAKDALEHYGLNGAYVVARMFREGDGEINDSQGPYIAQLARRMDAIMEGQSLQEAITVHRTVGSVRVPGGKPKVGATFTDASYSSASSRKGAYGHRGKFNLNITAPAGTRALSVPNDPKLLDRDEVIFDRGYTYRITGVGEPDANGVREIDVEVVPGPKAGSTTDRVQAARARQARIDTARKSADLLAELEERIGNGESPEVTDRAVRATAKRLGLPESTVDEMRTNPDSFAAAQGLTRVSGPAGSVEPYDPKKHKALGKVRPGQMVTVVRPGYSHDPGDGSVVLDKAVVEEADDIPRAKVDDDQLHHYWTRGEGLAKWRTHPHPWTALRNHLRKHVPLASANRMASQWFKEVFGYWPGSRKGTNPVGPG